ncbi:MAG: hypothetical protein H6Q77_1790 [Gemmatimonadetes bacterium]|jgi:hypothetical protein|nr:hypothetical protein [Gemmatimonadota bacterium]
MSEQRSNDLVTIGIPGTQEDPPMLATTQRRLVRLAGTLAVCWLGLGPLAVSAADAQTHFAGPGAALDALVAAVRAGDAAAFDAIFGPGSEDLRSSGDAVADKAVREKFLDAAEEHIGLEHPSPDRVLLSFGDDDWPFPIPLVKSDKGWVFDTAAGKEEIINRRIGRNELHAIAVVRGIVDAQEEYADADPTGSGMRQYAQRILSSPGQRDGLYWKSDANDSPLGELVAVAVQEGYGGVDRSKPVPYHGYYFRLLKGQGKHAPGGAKSYLKDGKLTGGFAVVAWPADYGNSGIKTFVVNQRDLVFEKDLGADTEKLAIAMTEYDPDPSWDPVEEPAD